MNFLFSVYKRPIAPKKCSLLQTHNSLHSYQLTHRIALAASALKRIWRKCLMFIGGFHHTPRTCFYSCRTKKWLTMKQILQKYLPFCQCWQDATKATDRSKQTRFVVSSKIFTKKPSIQQEILTKEPSNIFVVELCKNHKSFSTVRVAMQHRYAAFCYVCWGSENFLPKRKTVEARSHSDKPLNGGVRTTPIVYKLKKNLYYG